MSDVRVKRHQRSTRRRLPAHPSSRRKRKEPSYIGFPQTLTEVVADVVAGRRKGFTWTGGYRFDVDDPWTMNALYEKLDGRTIYVVARTNRTAAQWRAKGEPANIGYNFGIGVWKDDDGTIYVDDIFVYDEFGVGPGPLQDNALHAARNFKQKSFLKVDGAARSFEFLDTGIDTK